MRAWHFEDDAPRPAYPAPTIRMGSVPIPPSRVVRLPGPYPHRFASMPLYWREVTIAPDPPGLTTGRLIRVVYPMVLP